MAGKIKNKAKKLETSKETIMKPKTSKTLDYYLNLPWKFEFEKAAEGGYYAKVKGLSCYSHGETLEKASLEIQEALECHLESCLENNIPISEPISDEECTGRLSLRVSKSLHCKLLEIAREEDVSISHLINDALVKIYDKAS